MALKRKRRFTEAVKCSLCKEVTAFHTIHGFRPHAGNTCCHKCFPAIKQQYEQQREKEASYEPTEADYQTWMRL